MGSPGPEARTSLFEARLSDPRERGAVAGERHRGRGPSNAGPTSDVTRFRGVLAAALTGAAVTAAAALLWPPAGGHASPGPLSRPHVLAELSCAACHDPGEGSRAAGALPEAIPSGPGGACIRCHGAHPSTRAGHRRALAAGALRCATCHPIHRSDQGVSFAPAASAIRFAPGVEVALPAGAFAPDAPVTVALPTAASCGGCHDLASARDPIARCLLPGQEALAGARPVVCLDEHQSALPSVVGQHGADRAAAWDAAREMAATMPVLPARNSGGGPFAWLGLGALAAAFAFAGVRGAHAIAARRRSRAAAPAPEGALRAPTRVRLPQIDTGTCLGCYACVDACPYDVLEVQRYVAVVVRPEACCGLTLCEQRCPNGSLRITEGEPIGEHPRLSDDLESPDTPGLYLAGDVTGLPLIKNAIAQGDHAATRLAASLRGAPRVEGALDLLIVGAGPAGISAALRAKELGLRFEVVEQGDVAQSIQSFPRGKLVFAQPLELPLAGKLWLQESSKEELLSHWLRIVRQERLPIHADTRMTGLVRGDDGVFQVTTEPREGGPPTERRARRVLLAIGQRGSPRRLPFELDREVESRVHYHLSDARSFEGKRVVVVGLGDVAMEAAVALGRQPSTAVTVVHRGEGFARGKARNIAEVRRMHGAGRLTLHFGAEVTSVSGTGLTLKTPAGQVAVPCDAVLVLIGSIAPSRTLSEAGVRTSADGPAPPA